MIAATELLRISGGVRLYKGRTNQRNRNNKTYTSTKEKRKVLPLLGIFNIIRQEMSRKGKRNARTKSRNNGRLVLPPYEYQLTLPRMGMSGRYRPWRQNQISRHHKGKHY